MRDTFFVPSNELFRGRRRTLAASGALLSASAIALLGGRDALAATTKASQTDVAADIRILNTALGAELEAIAAYQVGAESGLLTSGVCRWRCSSRATTRRMPTRSPRQ